MHTALLIVRPEEVLSTSREVTSIRVHHQSCIVAKQGTSGVLFFLLPLVCFDFIGFFVLAMIRRYFRRVF